VIDAWFGWLSELGRKRIHLDLTTASLEDQHESVSRLVELGARHIDIGQSLDEPHVVPADPKAMSSVS
jgi:hypothetical protein